MTLVQSTKLTQISSVLPVVICVYVYVVLSPQLKSRIISSRQGFLMLPLYSHALPLIILLHHNFVISRMLYEWKHSLPDLITDLRILCAHDCLLLPWKDSWGARSVFCDPACWSGEATGGASERRSGALSSVRHHTHCAKGLGEFLIAEKRFRYFFFTGSKCKKEILKEKGTDM